VEKTDPERATEKLEGILSVAAPAPEPTPEAITKAEAASETATESEPAAA
jgi:hypothetical protein